MTRVPNMIVRVCALAVASALLAAVLGGGAALADGSAPDYPGSVLHASVTPPAIEGRPIDIVATGSNQISNPALGVNLNYGLDVYVVDPTKLPGPCQTSDSAESTNIANNSGSGRQLTFEQLNEGISGPFSITVPFTPEGTGLLLVCAYSEYLTDDAAWATTEVQVTSGLPAIVAPPRVRQTGRLLRCSAGTWTGDPTGFEYRWVLASSGRLLGRHPALAVTSRLRRRTVKCVVTASNASGTATASSSVLTAH